MVQFQLKYNGLYNNTSEVIEEKFTLSIFQVQIAKTLLADEFQLCCTAKEKIEEHLVGMVVTKVNHCMATQ